MTPTEDHTNGDEARPGTARYAAEASVMMRRLTLLIGVYIVAVSVGAYLGAQAGLAPRGPMLVVIGVIAVSGIYAGTRAWQTTSPARVRELEVQHMLVWVSTILACMSGGIVWVFAGGEVPPATLIWGITVVALIGWAATRTRMKTLIAGDD